MAMPCWLSDRGVQCHACVKHATPEEPAELADPEHELPLHPRYACFWSDLKAAQPPDCPRVVPHILPVEALHLHVWGLRTDSIGFVKLVDKRMPFPEGVT